MAAIYTPIRIGEMHKVLQELGFEQKDPDGRCWEHVYERHSANYHCTIRIYTSIDIRTSVTRECAKDAIRMVVINEAGYPVKEKGQSKSVTINRTQNALTRIRDRYEELRDWAKAHTCRTCYHPLVERRVKKEGPNKGRYFLTCVTEGCNHFEWVK